MYIIFVNKYLDILNKAKQDGATEQQIGGVPPVAIALGIFVVYCLRGIVHGIHSHNKIWKNAYLDAAIFDYATKSVKWSKTTPQQYQGQYVDMSIIPRAVVDCTQWQKGCEFCGWKMKFCMCNMTHRASQMRSLENFSRNGPGPFRNIGRYCFFGIGNNNSDYDIEWETEKDCNRLLRNKRTTPEVEVDQAKKRLESGYEVEGYNTPLTIKGIRDNIIKEFGDEDPPEGHPLVNATYQSDADYKLVYKEKENVDIVQKQISKEMWWENVFNRMEDRVVKLETKLRKEVIPKWEDRVNKAQNLALRTWIRGGGDSGGDNGDLMAIFELIHTEYENNNNFDITELSETIYEEYPNLCDTFFNWKEGTALDYVTKWINVNKESISNADDIVSLLSDASANPDNINIKDILEKIIPESLPNRIVILENISSFYEDETRNPESEGESGETNRSAIQDLKAELEAVRAQQEETEKVQAETKRLLSSGPKKGGSRRIKLTRRRRKRKAKKSQRKLRKRTRRRRKGKAKKSRAKRRRTRR